VPILRYPNIETQKVFFSHYLADPTSTSGSSSSPPRVDLSPEQLERLSAEVNVFALASHMYWGVWAIIQARYSPIDFDYMGYVGLRWGEYYRRKEEFLGKARQLFG
jgi:ethanolamine kinase